MVTGSSNVGYDRDLAKESVEVVLRMGEHLRLADEVAVRIRSLLPGHRVTHVVTVTGHAYVTGQQR